MARKKYQTRLPADTADEVDEFIDEREISQAEGIRRLVESGLDAQDEPDEATDDEVHRAASGPVFPLVIIVLLVLNLAVSLGAL